MVQHLTPGDEIEVFPVEVFMVGRVAVRNDPRIAIGLTTEEAEQFVIALDTDSAQVLVRLVHQELHQEGGAA